jgi:hypothetical protein
VEDFRAVERIRQRLEAAGLDHLEFGKVAPEGFIHHIGGGMHELGNANCHGLFLDLNTRARRVTNKKLDTLYFWRYRDEPASGQSHECLFEVELYYGRRYSIKA